MKSLSTIAVVCAAAPALIAAPVMERADYSCPITGVGTVYASCSQKEAGDVLIIIGGILGVIGGILGFGS